MSPLWEIAGKVILAALTTANIWISARNRKRLRRMGPQIDAIRTHQLNGTPASLARHKKPASEH